MRCCGSLLHPGHSTLLQSSEFILAYTRQTDLLYSTTLLYYYSLQDEAQLTLLGEVIARGHMEAWLVTRLRLIHAWATPTPNPNPNPTNPAPNPTPTPTPNPNPNQVLDSLKQFAPLPADIAPFQARRIYTLYAFYMHSI